MFQAEKEDFRIVNTACPVSAKLGHFALPEYMNLIGQYR